MRHNSQTCIVGIGIDIIEVDRITASCQRWGTRFEQRIYTIGELNYSGEPPLRYQKLATRFAAKEATFKALGTGLINDIGWKDVEVLPDKLGKPILTLSNGAKRYAEKIGVTDNMITLSHTAYYAIANVILLGHPEQVETSF
jgi:holo-[acyl-carrier protein] synthase